MPILDTKHKRESAAITGVIALLILFLIFNFGMTYFDPPIEYGIAINFGTSDVGSGDVQPTESLKAAAEEIENEEEIVEEVVVQEQVETAPTAAEAAAENVITQNNEEAIAIKKQENIKRKQEADRQKQILDAKKEADRKAEVERKKIEAENQRIEKEKQEKAAKRKSLDAMMGGLNSQNGNASGGEGNDNQAGDKGKVTGDPNASGYYGNGGGGGGGDYQLGNRKVLTKPKPTYDCNEEGRVFVSISVDTSGKVISAQAGVKGTTNSAPCLLTRAKEAALKTKFNSDGNAPAKQIGIIIYNFSLSE